MDIWPAVASGTIAENTTSDGRRGKVHTVGRPSKNLTSSADYMEERWGIIVSLLTDKTNHDAGRICNQVTGKSHTRVGESLDKPSLTS